MTRMIREATWMLRSDNHKSKIKNAATKWAGLITLALALTMCGAVAEAQQPARIPRIGILIPISASFYFGPGRSISPTAARAWLCRRKKHCH